MIAPLIRTKLSSLSWLAEEVSPIVDVLSLGRLFRKNLVRHKARRVLLTAAVDVGIVEVLAAESANQIVLLQLLSVFVDELGPLLHLVSGFPVKFILVKIVFFLELLRRAPNDVVLHLQEALLFLVVLDQKLAFGKLPRQIVRVNVNVDLELFGRSVFHVLI